MLTLKEIDELLTQCEPGTELHERLARLREETERVWAAGVRHAIRSALTLTCE